MRKESEHLAVVMGVRAVEDQEFGDRDAHAYEGRSRTWTSQCSFVRKGIEHLDGLAVMRAAGDRALGCRDGRSYDGEVNTWLS